MVLCFGVSVNGRMRLVSCLRSQSEMFDRAELGKAEVIVVPTFPIVKGVLKGTQMRCGPAQAAGTLASL